MRSSRAGMSCIAALRTSMPRLDAVWFSTWFGVSALIILCFRLVLCFRLLHYRGHDGEQWIVMRAHDARAHIFALKHALHDRGVCPLYDSDLVHASRDGVGGRVQFSLHPSAGHAAVDQLFAALGV